LKHEHRNFIGVNAGLQNVTDLLSTAPESTSQPQVSLNSTQELLANSKVLRPPGKVTVFADAFKLVFEVHPQENFQKEQEVAIIVDRKSESNRFSAIPFDFLRKTVRIGNSEQQALVEL
jgi:hypothetical protein